MNDIAATGGVLRVVIIAVLNVVTDTNTVASIDMVVIIFYVTENLKTRC